MPTKRTTKPKATGAVIRINGHAFSPNTVKQAYLDYSAQLVQREDAMTSPDSTRNYLRVKIGTLEKEVFGGLWLDNRNRLINDTIHFTGTIDGCSVHPREIVKHGLMCNAAALILYHNHPSGVAEPSQADEMITRRLRDALGLIDIRVLDHIIVSGDSFVSFAERGLI